MAKTLLQGVTRGLPDGATVPAPDASEPHPLGALKLRTLRALHRDLKTLGVERDLADKIVPMVFAALKPALEADVSIEDMTAACLVAERVMLATAVAILQRPPDSTDD